VEDRRGVIGRRIVKFIPVLLSLLPGSSYVDPQVIFRRVNLIVIYVLVLLSKLLVVIEEVLKRRDNLVDCTKSPRFASPFKPRSSLLERLKDLNVLSNYSLIVRVQSS